MVLINMGANKIFGILLLMMFMAQMNMADEKGYSESLVHVPNVVEDQVPMERDLHYDTILNIALFPYIPDLDGDNHRNLLNYIRDEFEQLNPTIHLVFRPMNDSENFYDVSKITTLLDGPGTVYDIVEVDTVILGDLVAAGVAAPQYLPFRYPPAEWHPAAVGGVTVNGEIYAYPHLICTILLFTRSTNISSAVTVDQLFQVVNAVSPPFVYGLVGDLSGSWDSAALYLDAYRETHFPYTDFYGNLVTYDNVTLESLRKIAQLCSIVYETQCTDGYFDEPRQNQPAQAFANYAASGTYGYSERLHQILKQATASGNTNNWNIKIRPLPLGQIPNEPLFFTDAFVFRKGMSYEKLAAAQKFVQFMATPRMQAAVAGAEATARKPYPPRYLLPMSSKAYNEHPLSTDYFYQTFFRNLTGRNLPNTGMNKFREIGKGVINPYISKPY